MQKNFETLEVGRRYENEVGEVVKIVENNGHSIYPFKGDDGEFYTPEGQFKSWQSGKFDLIELLPEQPTNRLAELEAKRAELDKEIEELRPHIKILYCEAEHFSDERIALVNKLTAKGRDIYSKNAGDRLITTFDLPFRKVDGKWEAAFKIVPK